MDRREVLRLLGSAAAISAFPLEAIAVIREASADVAQSRGIRTLDPSQNALVTTIAELIIPATDTPGAEGAKVNEFIDLLLTEWYEPAETREFLAGLASVDMRTKKRFGSHFIDCSTWQQTEMLKELDAEAMQFAASQKKAAQLLVTQPQANASLQQTHAVPQQTPTPAPPNFFYQMKKLTLAGYYTTEIGFTRELGKDIVPLKHAGCAPVEEVAR